MVLNSNIRSYFEKRNSWHYFFNDENIGCGDFVDLQKAFDTVHCQML